MNRNVTLFLQKNAVAVAYAKQGKGVLRLNGELRGFRASPRAADLP